MVSHNTKEELIQLQDMRVINESELTEQLDVESTGDIFLLKTNEGIIQIRKKAQLIVYKSTDERKINEVRKKN